MIIFVQYENDTEEKIISVFSSEQSSEFWDNLGIVEDDDPRLLEFYEVNGSRK